MLDQGKLQSSIAQAIFPYSRDSVSESTDTYSAGDDIDNLNDLFVTETAIFLTQEVVHSGLDIGQDLVELEDDDLENLPLVQVLVPRLEELIAPKDPIAIVSTVIQIYTSPEPVEAHYHVRFGDCEVHILRHTSF
jgi:hypothetical protein